MLDKSAWVVAGFFFSIAMLVAFLAFEGREVEKDYLDYEHYIAMCHEQLWKDGGATNGYPERPGADATIYKKFADCRNRQVNNYNRAYWNYLKQIPSTSDFVLFLLSVGAMWAAGCGLWMAANRIARRRNVNAA